MTRAVAAIVLLAACPTHKKSSPADDEAAKPGDTTLHDVDGNLVATLEVEASACTIRATETLTVTGDKDRLELKAPGDELVASLARGPAGRTLADGEGNSLARVVTTGPDRVDVLDPTGVARFRLRVDGASVVLRDRAGVPFRTVTREGGRWVASDRDGAVQAYIAGTDDPVVAGLLVADTTTLQHRTLLACDRLLTP